MKVHDRGKPAQRMLLAVCGAAMLLSVPARTADLTLDLRAINEAVLLGQTRVEADRRRFHMSYRVAVAPGSEIDFIEVVTPYRRVVLAAEDHAAAGDRSFGHTQAVALLETAPQQVDLHVEMTFNPRNVYVGVPAYRVALEGPGGARIEPRTSAVSSRYTPRLSERPSVTAVPGGAVQPGRSQPLVGGTIVAGFDGRLLSGPATYSAVITLEGKDVARGRVDLGKMR